MHVNEPSVIFTSEYNIMSNRLMNTIFMLKGLSFEYRTCICMEGQRHSQNLLT